MLSADVQKYLVIPLSVQKDGELYTVGNIDIGDFYQFPEQGLRILNMLGSGDTAGAIKSRLVAEHPDMVDVDDFVTQLTAIGFIYPQDQIATAERRLHIAKQDKRRTFNVDPRIANAIFSLPGSFAFLAAVAYAVSLAVEHPELRANFDAFYIDTNRTALLLLVMVLSFVLVVMHELGHMLAASKHGIRSKYGIGTRLWNIVAESDLTGILTLPRSQRYLPMLAGLLVDVLCISLLTIGIQILLNYGANGFTIQVMQALVLENLIAITWQFNIFVKTDIYFVLCNYFNHPDLDKAARTYLRHLLCRASFGRLGSSGAAADFPNTNVLRIFSMIWLFGRALSLLTLFAIFLPTAARYIGDAIHSLSRSSASIWEVCDTMLPVTIALVMLGAGMYMWLTQK